MLSAGCNLGDPQVDLRITHFDHVPQSDTASHLPTDSIAVTPLDARIRVAGTVRLPDHCDDLKASVAQDGDSLQLLLRAARNDGHSGCDPSQRTVILAFVADIEPVTPGAYAFRVGYRYDDDHPDPAGADYEESRLGETLFAKRIVVE